MEAEASKIIEESGDSIISGFDHFSVPETATSVTRGRYEWIQPQAGGSKTDMFEFSLEKGDGVYTDLAKMFLKFDVVVRTAAGANLDANVNNVAVWPTENFAHSLLQNVSILINDMGVEYTPYYAHQSYIFDRINYDPNTMNSTMVTSSGWIKDGAVGKDAGDHPAAVVTARKNLIAGGNKMSFYVRIRSGFLNNERYLFPGFSFKVKFTRSTPAFCLNAANNNPAGGARIEIESCLLYAYRIKANSSLFAAQMDLAVKGAKLFYPMRRMKTQTKMLTANTTTCNVEIISQKARPNRLIVAFVRANAFAGRYDLNPFHAPHYDINRVELSVQGMGETIVYEPNFRTGADLARPYAALASLVDRYDSDKPFAITFDEWKTDACYWGFDLTEDNSRTDNFQLQRSGRLELRLNFNTPLPHNVMAVAVMEFDDVVTLGLDNTVTTQLPLL